MGFSAIVFKTVVKTCNFPMKSMLHLSHPLRQLILPELQQIHHPLLAEVHPLDIRDILSRRPCDSARDHNGIQL